MQVPERSEATYRSERFGLTPEDVVGRASSEVISDADDAEFCM